MAKACRSILRLSIGIAGCFLQPVGNVTILHEYAHIFFKSDFDYKDACYRIGLEATFVQRT